MKRMFALCVTLLLLAAPFARAGNVDLSAVDYDELVALKGRINRAIWESDKWRETTVPQDIWEVSVDIPSGYWAIQAIEKAASDVVARDMLDDSKTSLVLPPSPPVCFYPSSSVRNFDETAI